MSWKSYHEAQRVARKKREMEKAISFRLKVKPPKVVLDVKFKPSKCDLEKQSPAPAQQKIINKTEQSRRNKKSVTLPSFKCLEPMED